MNPNANPDDPRDGEADRNTATEASIEHFQDLAINGDLRADIAAAGWETPTPIQARGLPVVLSGRDLIGCAQTGSGKTGVFVMQILQRLREAPPAEDSDSDSDAKPRRQRGRGQLAFPKALILAPTRELAQQANDVIAELSRSAPAPVAVLVGGQRYGPQRKALEQGAAIVVATPGRLLDHLEQHTLSLDAVEIVVIDEADRMFDMGFAPQIRRVLERAPRQRQTLMFSATMPAALTRLANEHLTDPVRIEVDPPSTPAEGVKQEVHLLVTGHKMDIVERLVKEVEGRILIFTRTKMRADQVARMLKRLEGVTVESLHADRTQRERDRALQRFREGEARVLIATDVASRGLDIEDIHAVVNYDFPQNVDDYVHRVGRTARADRTGRAVSFVEPGDLPVLEDVEARLGERIPRPGRDTERKSTGILKRGRRKRRR